MLRAISNGKWVFKETELQRKADSLGFCDLSEDIAIVGSDAERPRKRARLIPQCLSDADSEIDVSALISHIYQLLGNQEASDLTGLSLVAR